MSTRTATAQPAQDAAQFNREIQQLGYRRDHKTLCLERALERCDYDAANIFSAQRDWIDGELLRLSHPDPLAAYRAGVADGTRAKLVLPARPVSDFQKRVDYAARAIMDGRTDSRKFDDCFEMFDGDAVVVALTRRASKNPALHQKIAAMFSGTFPQSWLDRMHAHEGENLQALSDSLIQKASA